MNMESIGLNVSNVCTYDILTLHHVNIWIVVYVRSSTHLFVFLLFWVKSELFLNIKEK